MNSYANTMLEIKKKQLQNRMPESSLLQSKDGVRIKVRTKLRI